MVDNASSDGSADRLESEYPRGGVHPCGSQPGFRRRQQLGGATGGEVKWLALLNPDAFPQPDWLERLLAAADKHPECASFGARLMDANDPGRLDGTGDVYHVSGRFGGAITAGSRPPVRVSVETSSRPARRQPCTVATLFSKRAVSTKIFCYFEDIDLGFRLRLLGYRSRYVPDAVVRHVGSAVTSRRSPFSLYHGHRNLVGTYVKNMPGPLFWFYLPQHLLLNLVPCSGTRCAVRPVLCYRPS